MSTSQPDPLEALPLPDGVIELPPDHSAMGQRAFAVMALQQVLAERQLALPLGPQTAFDDTKRLLSMNGCAVQLCTAGITADLLAVDLVHWRSAASSPQLLLAALVDEENDLVVFPGVLTGSELLELASGVTPQEERIDLLETQFKGGLERLLTLVQLLEPGALPRVGLSSSTATASMAVEAVRNWMRGQLNDASTALGGQLIPVTAGAFRSGSAPAGQADQGLAMLVIPFGLKGDQLVSGDAASRCVRRFQLALIATGTEQPTGLVLRLSSSVPGSLLPDDLELRARQASHEQVLTSHGSTVLELTFRGADLLQVSLRFGEADPIELPSLQLPSG